VSLEQKESVSRIEGIEENPHSLNPEKQRKSGENPKTKA
jgi:transposase